MVEKVDKNTTEEDEDDDLERRDSSGSLTRDMQKTEKMILRENRADENIQLNREAFSLQTFKMKDRIQLINEMSMQKGELVKQKSISPRRNTINKLAIIPEFMKDDDAQ